MPKATATIDGKVIATADKWEEVEGNVYVSQPVTLCITKPNDVPSFLPRKRNHLWPGVGRALNDMRQFGRTRPLDQVEPSFGLPLEGHGVVLYAQGQR